MPHTQFVCVRQRKCHTFLTALITHSHTFHHVSLNIILSQCNSSLTCVRVCGVYVVVGAKDTNSLHFFFKQMSETFLQTSHCFGALK